MLNPNGRSLYTAALTPPPGLVFDEALATTFSLDPAVLLTVPVHLALLGGNQRGVLRDGLAVLEAIRRLSDRITVYAQRGRLQVPSPAHVLYGLLESMVVEVAAPRGGVFHPKLWLMRFVDPAKPDAVLLRLLVLSRNLTTDRSWDVALTLEGRPTGRYRAESRALGEMVRDLPQLAFRDVPEARVTQAARLADELRRTEWELPWGFDSVAFHVLGLKRGGWSPTRSSRLAVISPFCTVDALRGLAATTGSADALVTRPETLAELGASARGMFGRCLGLDEAAETEDGEDIEGAAVRDTHGLHAKVYVFERGWDTHVVVGSANATSAALIAAKNVEVLAELVGKRSRVGGVEKLLGAEGLGEVLADLPESGEPPTDDAEQRAAEKALEAARDALGRAALRVRCTSAGDDDTWALELRGAAVPSDGVASVRVWPITVGDDHAVTVAADGSDTEVRLGAFGAASITGLIAFELRAAARDLRVRLVLNLPLDGLPEARDAAVLQTVVRNRDGFLRYLLLLLGDLGFGPPPADGDGEGSESRWTTGGPGSMPLLEELVRAYAREPERLREVGRVVRRLCEGSGGDDIVPADFIEMWRVFEAAMERRNG